MLSTGVFSLLCLIAKGNQLGLENKLLKRENKHLRKIKQNIKHIRTPVDLAFNINGKRKDLSINKPQNYKALDIGKDTIDNYTREIKKAKSIFWKGTAGNCAVKNFCLGTKKLLKAMEKSKAFCIVAGGHSTTSINRYNINKKNLGYVSLSGGALVHYIAGKKLPGLEVLKNVWCDNGW